MTEMKKGILPAGPKPTRQQGMSLIGLVLVAILVVFAAITVMKVVPMYLDDLKLKTIFGNLEQEAMSSPNEIRTRIKRNLEVNQLVNMFDDNQFEIRQTSDGHQVSIDYERRAHLFGNLSVVAEFKHSARVRR
ncbi:MAG TPA: DUF4845 domain-containing protein [Halothiobacillaceae bacterium]|nr:DUF4845 domain-containing protein [Halothiobacillaceae bacterium]